MMSDKIWYDDIFVLFRRPLEFFPVKNQSKAEHLNALVRLCIYVTLGLFIYNQNMQTLALGLAAIVVISMVYRGRGNVAGYDILGKCRRPTQENPFANTLVSEYGKPQDPPCSYDDMKDDMEKHFNHGLHRNVEDWSNRENSQRQFVTHPTGGNPPDTKGFAEFLYAGSKNCKTRPEQCY
jgi:hypothetical protein